MLKDGYVNVLGAYLPVEIDPYLDKDGNEIKINPCPKCGCKDQEVVVDNIYEPSGYRLKCAMKAAATLFLKKSLILSIFTMMVFLLLSTHGISIPVWRI